MKKMTTKAAEMAGVAPASVPSSSAVKMPAVPAQRCFGFGDSDVPLTSLLPYYNMCGLVGLRDARQEVLGRYHAAIVRAHAACPQRF